MSEPGSEPEERGPEERGPEPAPSLRPPVDRRAFLRDALLFSALALAPVCAIAAVTRPMMAISLGIGGLLAGVNLVFLVRAVTQVIDGTVEGVAAAQGAEQVSGVAGEAPAGIDPEKVARPGNVGAMLRLLMLAGVVLVVLWRIPVDPVGLALAFIVVLAAAVGAAVRQERARSAAVGPAPADRVSPGRR